MKEVDKIFGNEFEASMIKQIYREVLPYLNEKERDFSYFKKNHNRITRKYDLLARKARSNTKLK